MSDLDMWVMQDEDKNYYIKDNKAYTEDDILVYNLFVHNIPKKATEAIVRNYFSKFGEIKRVRVIADKKRSKRFCSKVGFINYVDPLVAAKVLEKNKHTLMSKRIAVKASYSWNQPIDRQAVANCSKDASADMVTDSLNILQLDDDCLALICKKLELSDQVRFARSCQRFRNILTMCSKVDYKDMSLDLFDESTLWDIRDFMKFTGSSIEKIDGSVPYKNRERIIEFISNSCPNLKVLSLDSNKITYQSLCKMASHLKNLTKIELVDCSLTDSIIRVIERMPSLEVLILSENSELTGNHMKKFKNIKELGLVGCCNIQTSYLLEALKALAHLLVLDIRRCARLSHEFYKEMYKHCPKLEEIKISYSDMQCENVTQLPCLKKLTILPWSYNMPLPQTLFANMSQHKGDQLEYLHLESKNCMFASRASYIGELRKLRNLICANNENLDDSCLQEFAKCVNLEEIHIKNCPKITNDGVLELLRKCKCLKLINVQQCPKLTNQLVIDAVKVLKECPQKHSETISLQVYGTAIQANVLVNYEGKSQLKVCFNEMRDFDIFDFYVDMYGEDDDDDDDDSNFPYDDYYDDHMFFSDTDVDDDEIHDAYDNFGYFGPYIIQDFFDLY